MELKGKKINFLGDSITEGIGTSDFSQGFVALIGREEGLAASRNYGIGGTRIARQTYPSENPVWDRDFCSRVETMDEDADVVVIFGGTNDYGHGDAPLGRMEDRTVWTFYGALHVLYSSLIERFPKARIVVLTPIHREGENSPAGDVAYKRAATAPLIEYVKIIRQVAEYYSLPVLDLYATSGIQPNLPVLQERLCPDGLHPNDEGNRLLAQRISAFLKIL